MPTEGGKSRNERLLRDQSGVWGTSSVDFVVLVRRLYQLSKEDADSVDGNCSRFVYCGIPMFLTGLRCLMVEYESFPPPNNRALEILTKPNDFIKMLEHYRVSEALLQDAKDLNEIRNEIIHPAHRPTGTPDNWPDYLRRLKNLGLLQSTGIEKSDFIFFAQIASHKLFAWACRVMRDIAHVILQSNPCKATIFSGFSDSYNNIGFEKDL